MKPVLKIWWIALAVKLVIAVLVPFANDESYYWVWGHHPHLSYFDHPAMVGWLFYLGTFLENFGNAARIPGVVLGHATLLIWSAILNPFLNEKQKPYWLVFLGLSPFLGIGSLVLTPDIPFLFFWSLSILFLTQAVESNRWRFYAALGVTLGFGFCSKYLIVLFVPCALAWLIGSGLWRSVDYKKVPLTIVLGLLFCTPVLLWNAQNDWASFKFQLDHGLESTQPNALWPLEYFGAQLGLLFPIAAYFALKKRTPQGTSFLHAFGWLPLAFFFYTSFRAHVEANWPSMGHPALLALAFLNASDSTASFKWLRAQAVIWIVAIILVFSQVIHPWIPLDPKKLKTSELTKYDILVPVARERQDLYFGAYQMAASVSYALKRQLYKLDGMNRRDFYDFTPQSHPTGDSFGVIKENRQSLPPWVAEAGYQIVSERAIGPDFRLLEVNRHAKDINR